MIHPLAGIRLKRNRALEHAKGLYKEIDRFDKSDPYEFTEEFTPATGEYRMFLAKATPPLKEWALTVGEILHNLRSALDHIVWQLAIANGNNPPAFPLPKGSPWKHLQFPIFIDQKEFQDQRKRYLWGVKDSAARFIERMQPFDTPTHALWLLGELSNIDKHRTLTVTSSYLRKVALIRHPGTQMVLHFLHPPGFIEGKTELAHVSIYPSPKLPMDMRRIVQIEVAFGKGMAPAEGENIVNALGRMGLATEKILKGIRPFLRPRP